MKNQQKTRFLAGGLTIIVAVLAVTLFKDSDLDTPLFNWICYSGLILGCMIFGAGSINESNGKVFYVKEIKEHQILELKLMNSNDTWPRIMIFKTDNSKFYMVRVSQSDLTGVAEIDAKYIKKSGVLVKLHK